jgi:hypothetical protein
MDSLNAESAKRTAKDAEKTVLFISLRVLCESFATSAFKSCGEFKPYTPSTMFIRITAAPARAFRAAAYSGES